MPNGVYVRGILGLVRIQFCTWNVLDVDVMITVCTNFTRTKYKSTNTTSSETTGSLFLAHGCFKFGNVIGQNEGDDFQKSPSFFVFQ